MLLTGTILDYMCKGSLNELSCTAREEEQYTGAIKGCPWVGEDFNQPGVSQT